MTPTTIAIIAGAATVLGTVGGLIEGKAKPGTGWYRVGNVLASIGVDLASLGKLFGAAQ